MSYIYCLDWRALQPFVPWDLDKSCSSGGTLSESAIVKLYERECHQVACHLLLLSFSARRWREIQDVSASSLYPRFRHFYSVKHPANLTRQDQPNRSLSFCKTFEHFASYFFTSSFHSPTDPKKREEILQFTHQASFEFSHLRGICVEDYGDRWIANFSQLLGELFKLSEIWMECPFNLREGEMIKSLDQVSWGSSQWRRGKLSVESCKLIYEFFSSSSSKQRQKSLSQRPEIALLPTKPPFDELLFLYMPHFELFCKHLSHSKWTLVSPLAMLGFPCVEAFVSRFTFNDDVKRYSVFLQQYLE